MKAISAFWRAWLAVAAIVGLVGCGSSGRGEQEGEYSKIYLFTRHIILEPDIPAGWKPGRVVNALDESMRLCSRQPWELRVYCDGGNYLDNYPGGIGRTYSQTLLAGSGFFGGSMDKNVREPRIQKYGAIQVDGDKIVLFVRGEGYRVGNKRSLVASFRFGNGLIFGVAAVDVPHGSEEAAARDIGNLIIAIKRSRLASMHRSAI